MQAHLSRPVDPWNFGVRVIEKYLDTRRMAASQLHSSSPAQVEIAETHGVTELHLLLHDLLCFVVCSGEWILVSGGVSSEGECKLNDENETHFALRPKAWFCEEEGGVESDSGKRLSESDSDVPHLLKVVDGELEGRKTERREAMLSLTLVPPFAPFLRELLTLTSFPLTILVSGSAFMSQWVVGASSDDEAAAGEETDQRAGGEMSSG